MKLINSLLIILFFSAINFTQINQPKQLTDFDFDSRNPAFIQYPINEPYYSFPGEVFFEAHTDSNINIYSMIYSAQEDSFLQPFPITQGNFKNRNLTGTITFDSAPYKLILWETNINGNWDIAYSKNYGSGFTQPQLLMSTEEDETSPSIVLDHFNYFFEELNVLFVQNDSILVFTKTDTSDLTKLIFAANESTTYSAPVGITYEGNLYAVAVEIADNSTPRLVYKTRHFSSTNWSNKSVAFEGDSVQNPKFVDAYYPFSPNVYLSFEIIKHGKKRCVLLSPNNFGNGNPPLTHIVEDSTIESSDFNAYSYYIVTERSNFDSPYPYAYKIKTSDSTFIISGSEEYWYEYKINTKFNESNIAIGPLSFYGNGIISYTVWEDSSNSRTNLFGLKRFDILSDIENEETPLATSFKLEQNYPNPFNPNTVISYRLPVSSNVTLKVYDVLGNEIATLVNKELPEGEYEVEFQSTVGSRQLTSGIYFYTLKTGEFIQTRKMVYFK